MENQNPRSKHKEKAIFPFSTRLLCLFAPPAVLSLDRKQSKKERERRRVLGLVGWLFFKEERLGLGLLAKLIPNANRDLFC